ncbi:hypothetical protein AXG93_1429s1010 [Marchantia polymorpha subsp. ruderalis]|uniref:Reverse transcriptase domain-containing protein n=1 Tax=Marchantia polymorpha subsp. ruderalis TaxID=1480154 RepID=A0A176W3U5_MARPO|nr:hypothetical protein AXG93_1429s1010 [Marchantia polymorpha subsp. ruderalis]
MPQQAGNGATFQDAQSVRRTGTIEQFYEKKKEGSVAPLTKIALTSASLQSKTRKEAVDEQTTATSPAPLVRRKKVAPRQQGEGAGEVQAADAGSKRKPVADGEQSGGRAKMAKNLPRATGGQVEPEEARENWTPPISPLVPKQLLETLAQKGGAKHDDSIPVQEQKGPDGVPTHKEGYEETVLAEQPEPYPLTEGIRAKFTRKQATRQGPLAVLGGKTLSMKSSAIRKRELRAAKAAARAASGGQKPNKRTMLSALPTEKEIEDVLFSLPLNKAPGVDGISAEALRKTWPHMKHFYVNMVHKFWEEGVLAESVTEGMIRLIPKSVNKTELKDWRPLTMLNTDYKIIARILAGRLQLLLQKIVFPQQTGFIKGRQMLDNVLALWMAQDAAKTIKRKGMFVKLDFEKAYDRVEHNYLWDTMNKCGLGQQFTALVKGLTVGASTAVHINGAKTYRFPVGRGVRQGCPLAPLLFVLATQPLMAEMKLSFQAGRLRGYQVGETVILDYSLFADDMGVFIDDSFESFQELRVVLAKYEGSSGARLNLSKSSILLLGMDRPPDWLPLTGCALMQRGEINKYLGAPTGLEVSKHQQDDFCTQKISKTLGGWELRLLSFEARVVLLQVVLQAQPTFYTSIIRLAATTCRKVEQLYRHFLWGYNKEGTAKRSLVRWDLVCRPKAQGGLGIRSLPDTNSSLMGKWVGSVIDEETGTWGGALSDLVRQGRAKYHRDVVRKHYSLSDLILTRQPLHLAGTDVAKALLTSWKAIQGDITWDPEGVAIPRYITLRDIVSLVANNRQDGEVATKQIMAGLRELKVTQIETLWRRRETLKRNFVRGRHNEQRRAEGSPLHEFLHKITLATGLCNTPLRLSAGWKIRDKPIKGNFTDAARNWYRGKPQATSLSIQLNRKWNSQKSEEEWVKLFTALWSSRNVNRDKLFVWRVLQQALYSNERASKMGHGDGRCPRGCAAIETISHIFFDCPFAKQVWRATANLRWGHNMKEQPIFGKATSLLHLIELGLANQKNSYYAAQWMLTTEICRHLWLSRNQKVFTDVTASVSVHGRTRNSIDKAISQWRESSADPPQRQWLEIVRILQKAIAMSIVTRIERWLENMLATVDRVEGRSEAPCTEGAAMGLEVTALPAGRA